MPWACATWAPTMAPMNAFLTLLGTETLSLRMERHCTQRRAGGRIPRGPSKAVEWVSYRRPAQSSPYHELAKKYLSGGYGSVFTFGVKGGYEAGIKLVESCSLFSHLANIGDSRSLVLHPASTTHRQLSDEQRLAAGAGPDVVRLSIGLETVEDLIEDLDRALGQATRS